MSQPNDLVEYEVVEPVVVVDDFLLEIAGVLDVTLAGSAVVADESVVLIDGFHPEVAEFHLLILAVFDVTVAVVGCFLSETVEAVVVVVVVGVEASL